MLTELPKDVKVGDPLILVTNNRYRSDEPVTVARIGRQYIYVARHGGGEVRERFDRKTGREDSNVGARAVLYTQAQYDEMRQRATLFEGLRKAGIDVRHEIRAEVGTDQLRALLAVMAPVS